LIEREIREVGAAIERNEQTLVDQNVPEDRVSEFCAEYGGFLRRVGNRWQCRADERESWIPDRGGRVFFIVLQNFLFEQKIPFLELMPMVAALKTRLAAARPAIP
jgi:hypothetical protein